MGLYDDDRAATTTGDVQDVIYWQVKYAALKLDAALATRQPEGAIKGILPDVVNGTTDVLQRYPNHAEVQAWKAKAEMIGKKLDPNASPADFKGNFSHWKDYSYEAAWRSYHIAKMAAADEDWTTCKGHASEAVTQFGRSLTRMELWPDDVKHWIKTSHAEMEALSALADKRR